MQAGKFENRDPASREAGTLLSPIPLFISNYIKKFLQTDFRKRQPISLCEKVCLFAILNLFI